MPRRRPSLVLASILAGGLVLTPAPSATAAAAPPAFTVEPLYDIEPTGEPWFFPVCPVPIPECPPSQGAYVRQLTTFGDLAVFTAFDFDHGEEVWATDGTPEGTRLVIDLCPGPCFSRPEILGRVGGKLLFSASATSPHGGFRLWATDGIEVHAIGVDELRPWYASPDAIDGWLYFSLGNSVWRSDGADLEPALDIPDPSSSRVVIQLFGIGSRAFARRLGSLSAPDDLWEILPTSREVLRGCTPSDWISEVAVLGDAAYFGARCVDGLSDLGPGLFRTDGSPGGTVRIRTFENGPPSFLLPTAREIFFLEGAMGSNGTPIYRIWRTDGTAAGTVRLTGFFPWLRMQLALGDRYLLFSTINQLHALDLTTGAIADLPIPPSGLVTADPSGSFALVGGRNGWWVTYGTPAQTFQVFTANPQAPSPLSAAVFLGVRAVFSGEHGVDGEDLWVMGLPTALDIPVLGWPGVLLLALLLAAAALRSLSRRHPVATRSG